MSENQVNNSANIPATETATFEINSNKYNHYSLVSQKVVERPEPKNILSNGNNNNNNNTEGK